MDVFVTNQIRKLMQFKILREFPACWRSWTMRDCHDCYSRKSIKSSIISLTLIAAWGQPPVSTAMIRSSSRALCRTRNSASSLVKMSFVTTHKLIFFLKYWQAASMRAVYINIHEPQVRNIQSRLTLSLTDTPFDHSRANCPKESAKSLRQTKFH